MFSDKLLQCIPALTADGRHASHVPLYSTITQVQNWLLQHAYLWTLGGSQNPQTAHADSTQDSSQLVCILEPRQYTDGAHIFNLQIYCSGIYHGSKIKVQKANWCLSAMIWIMFHSLFTSTTFLLVTFMFGATTNPSKVSESITSNPWFCENLNLIKDSNNQVREISFAQCFNICISFQFHPEAQIQPVIISFYMQSSNWQEIWFWNPPSQIKLIFRVKSFTIKGHVYHRSPKPDPVRSKSSAFSSIRTRALDETLL